MIYKKILTFSLCLAVSFTVACESDENNKIAQAETCINENAGNQSGIASCASFLKGINTPRAKTLKCSITLESSGLSNKRIVSAVELMDNDSASDKELQFMALIALNSGTNADKIPSTCSGTDSPGIEFIANAARMGTELAIIGLIDLSTIDEDRTFSAGELNTIVDNCDGAPSCKETIGESASAMYDVFCEDADLAENEVCADVHSAITTGTDAESIGEALIALLDPTP